VNIPHDSDAELAIVGSLTVWNVNVPTALQSLDASDFYVLRHQRLFLAVKTLYERGEAIEHSGILDEMRCLGETDLGWLGSATISAERNIAGAIRVVTQMSLRRRLLAESLELQKSSTDLTADPADALDAARTSLASIETSLSGAESDDEDVGDFLSRTQAKPPPWVVHGLMREKWRTVIVAPPGEGKTVLIRQIGTKARYGRRPFRDDLGSVRPVSTLTIDLENTDDHIYASLERLERQAKREATEPPAPGRLLRRPGGINLRSRTDRAMIEKMLVNRRPELLIMGPLKNAYKVTGSDSWDLIAREVQGVLNDWRERFNLTMLIEDHAPHGLKRPFGSSLWESYPEIGLFIESEAKGKRELTRWRGDRMPTDWPEALSRGTKHDPWMWNGIFPTGTLNGEAPEQEEIF
jgi:hypothetical protein